jgi:hypothetical protein
LNNSKNLPSLGSRRAMCRILESVMPAIIALDAPPPVRFPWSHP